MKAEIKGKGRRRDNRFGAGSWAERKGRKMGGAWEKGPPEPAGSLGDPRS